MEVLSIRNANKRKNEYMEQIIKEKGEVLVAEDEVATHILCLTPMKTPLNKDVIRTRCPEGEEKSILEYFMKSSMLYVCN